MQVSISRKSEAKAYRTQLLTVFANSGELDYGEVAWAESQILAAHRPPAPDAPVGELQPEIKRVAAALNLLRIAAGVKPTSVSSSSLQTTRHNIETR